MSPAPNHYPLGAALTLDSLEADPHPHLALLRQHEPVSWVPVFNGWLVTSHELAVDVMTDDETYTVDDPRFSTAQVIGPSMLSLDGTAHARHRDPFVDPFRASEVRRNLEDGMMDRARTLVRGFAGSGRADLRADLAAPLAVDVMSIALGLEGVDASALLTWYGEIVAAVDVVTAGGEVPADGIRAFHELKQSVESAIEASPESLPAVVSRSADLTTDEIVSNIAVLLFGGIVTSEGTTSTLFHQLLLNPDQLAAVRRDGRLVKGAVEEALRFEPAASMVDRYATRDTQLGSSSIGAGELVRVSLASAGRDGSVFDDPDRFDIHRQNASRHLAFARGPHACIGLHLARRETGVALQAVVEELPSVELEPDSTQGPRGLIFRGPVAVGAAWAPRTP